MMDHIGMEEIIMIHIIESGYYSTSKYKNKWILYKEDDENGYPIEKLIAEAELNEDNNTNNE